MAEDRLHFTNDDRADRLLVEDPMALLVGFALDQMHSMRIARRSWDRW